MRLIVQESPEWCHWYTSRIFLPENLNGTHHSVKCELDEALFIFVYPPGTCQRWKSGRFQTLSVRAMACTAVTILTIELPASQELIQICTGQDRKSVV